MYNGKSISENVEYTSVIYFKNGFYKYSIPVKGNENSVSVPKNPYRTTLSAIIHSHAKYDQAYNNEEFSTRDRNVADARRVPMYLTTPGGKLMKYYYKDPVLESTINSLMQRDPNAP